MSTQGKTNPDKATALQRKLAGGGDGRSPARSVLRALRLAMARTAKAQMGLALSVIGARQAGRDEEDLPEAVPENRLHILLDGPDGARGGICLDRACVTALTQQQTIGQVLSVSAPDRPFTGTDAAMMAPLIDGMLGAALELVEEPRDRACLDGFRFGARAEDRRSLLLALEAERFRIFELTLDIGGGAVQGGVTLLLPEVEDRPGQSASGSLRPGLEQSFGVVRAELSAVVARLQLPLSRLGEMRPGDLLPLVQERLDQTQLLTIDGQLVAVGRLGQIGGLRALRVNETRAPASAPPQNAEAFSETGSIADPEEAEDDVIEAEILTAQEEDPENGLPGVSDPDVDDDRLMTLSAGEAAAEIAQLAGLPAPDQGAGSAG